MKLFIKNNLPLLILYFFNMIFLVFIYYWMGGFENFFNLLYFFFLSTFFLIIFLAYSFFKDYKFYKILSTPPAKMEESLKILGDSPLSKRLNELLKKQYFFYQADLQKYIKAQKDHLTFINQWVHQMKTPLSVIQLIIEENEDEQSMRDIAKEADQLNEGLTMALYLARLDSFQQDFHVEAINLEQLIFKETNEFKRLFIRKYVFPEVTIEDSLSIQSDAKWLSFLIRQLLTNAIKYSDGKNKKIYISAFTEAKNIILKIKDEGVGIPQSDIKRIFEPFYTGENGRKFGESTGMGLYLVQKVCERLNHKIEIESEVGLGTTIKIIF